MKHPHHLTALVTAGQFMAEQMDYKLVLSELQPGYLVALDRKNRVLLSCYIGTQGRECDDMMAQIAIASCCYILNNAFNQPNLVPGTVSSACADSTIRSRAGAVATAELVVGYASRDGRDDDARADEAVATMIAFKAGILPRSAIKKLFSNRHLKEHNPQLRLLMDNITWTS